MTTCVVSSVTLEATRAPTCLANLFTMICGRHVPTHVSAARTKRDWVIVRGMGVEELWGAPVGGDPTRTTPAPSWLCSAHQQECCSPCSPTESRRSWRLQRPSRSACDALGEVLRCRAAGQRAQHQHRESLQLCIHLKVTLVYSFIYCKIVFTLVEKRAAINDYFYI